MNDIIRNIPSTWQTFTHFQKNVKILVVELHCFIWNHHGKFIQTRTNMPGIRNVWNFEKQIGILFVWMVIPMAACKILRWFKFKVNSK